MADSEKTKSLILRLQDPAQRKRAIREFSERYGPKILAWAQWLCSNHADADDVAQNVSINVWQSFERGRKHDPNVPFRSWLVVVTRNAATDVLRRKGILRPVGGTTNLRQLNEVEAVDALVESLDPELRREEQELLAHAEAEAERETNPMHWRIYLLRKEGIDPEEIATQTGMTYGNVNVVWQRVREKVANAVKRLGGDVVPTDGAIDGQSAV